VQGAKRVSQFLHHPSFVYTSFYMCTCWPRCCCFSNVLLCLITEYVKQTVHGLVILSINFLCIHLTYYFNVCLKCNSLFIDVCTIAYIYNVVLYIFTTLLPSNVLHFSNPKNSVPHNNFSSTV